MTVTRAYTDPDGVAVLRSVPDDGDGPLKVRGVALTEGDKTHGASRKRLIWPPEVVKDAAEALRGTKIVDDREHEVPEDGDLKSIPKEPPIDTIVGEVTESRYEPGLGVVFEGEIDDPKVASLVENGRVDVSPFAFYNRGDYDEKEDTYTVDRIQKWRDLAVVANGAGSDASIEAVNDDESGYSAADSPDMAENPRFSGGTAPAAMSAAVLSAALDASFDENDDSDGDDEDQRPEPSHDDDDGEDSGELAAEALASFNHLSYDGTKSGKLDETKIDDEDFKSKYLFPGETKSDSSFPVVDAAGNLRRGNVSSAWDLRGQAPVSKEEIEQVLVTLASKFDDPPQTREDAEALTAQNSDEPAESGVGSSANADDDADADADANADDDGQSNPSDTMDLNEEEEKSLNRYRALDNPVVVEKDVEALADKADEADLDSYDDPHVIEGSDYEEPHVSEKDDFESLSERVGQVENVLAEALAERTGMKEETAAALSIEALFSEFEDDEGDFDAAALVQEPETGDNGEGSDNPNDDGGDDDPEDNEEAEALAETVMTVSDWRTVEAEALTARDYVSEEYGVDPSECSNEQQLRRKMASEGGD